MPANNKRHVITALAPSEVSRQLSWREGMLSFEDQTLREAADEFARYSDTRITFADPAIGLAVGYAINKQGPGILMNDRGQSLIDAAYACAGAPLGA